MDLIILSPSVTRKNREKKKTQCSKPSRFGVSRPIPNANYHAKNFLSFTKVYRNRRLFFLPKLYQCNRLFSFTFKLVLMSRIPVWPPLDYVFPVDKLKNRSATRTCVAYQTLSVRPVVDK